MGLKELLNSQKTIRDLQSEVAALTRQMGEAERLLATSCEKTCHIQKEAERQEKNQDSALQIERRSIEHELFRVLQPLLLNLPTARAAIVQNPGLLARDMIGMFAPLDDFVQKLGLQVIGQPGEALPYDSTRHDCPTAAAAGAPVTVVTVGYCRGEEIWIKARVKEQVHGTLRN